MPMTPLPDLSQLSHAQKDALIHALWAQVQALLGQVETLSKRVAELEARLNEPPKNSGNSSVPPSKGFKPNKDTDKGKGGADKTERSGPRAGSVGRKGAHRPLAENPDEIVRVMARACTHCGGALSEDDQTLQSAYDKVEIPPVRPVVTRVEIYAGVCPCCAGKTVPAVVPEGLEPGSPFGAGIMALALYLRFIHAIGYERLSRTFCDLFGLAISEGALNALLRRAKPNFDREVTAILARLRKSRVICSDETGVRVDGVGWWNWVFQNDDVVLHVIRKSRGRAVVTEVLDGHRPALWVSDLYAAQQGHAAAWQVCLAHQLRDCRYAIEAGDAVFAPRMKRLILRAFTVAKRRRELACSTRRAYKARLERDLDAIMALAPTHEDGRRLRKRYGKCRDSLFTFLDHPEIAPDNNSSERALRPTATYRKVTGGFRSEWGADLYAAFRSVVGTAARKGINAFAAIKNVLAPQAA